MSYSENMAKYWTNNMPHSYAAITAKETEANIRAAKMWIKGIALAVIFGGGFIGFVQMFVR